jgi:membrane protein DedA with SNARE-associated domain
MMAADPILLHKERAKRWLVSVPSSILQQVLEFIQIHLILGESDRVCTGPSGSFVGSNIFIPAGTILTSVAVLIGAGIISWTFVPCVAAGATLGGALSYVLGAWVGPRAIDFWPLKGRAELLERAHELFQQYGTMAVFIGYFVGPLRGLIPFAAGMAGMAHYPFHVANVLSAIIWVCGIIAPGAILGGSLGSDDRLLLIAPILVPLLAIVASTAVVIIRRALAAKSSRQRQKNLTQHSRDLK